jgi:ferredoxin
MWNAQNYPLPAGASTGMRRTPRIPASPLYPDPESMLPPVVRLDILLRANALAAERSLRATFPRIDRIGREIMTYIIAQPCIDTKDASCVDVCPVDCIYEGEDQYYIHPEECIDCGACVPECPVEAIFPDDEVPEQWTEYIAKNYVRFDVPPPA